MFFEEGWVPISDVTSEVFRAIQGALASGEMRPPKGGLTGVLALSVWDICDATTKFGVTAADGTVIPASKEILAWADPESLSNEHVNLRAGTVGSSDLPDEKGKMPSREQLIDRYGSFLGLPVVIPLNGFQSSMTFLAEELKRAHERDQMVVDAAKTILRMAEAGFVTREVARTTLGASLSRRKFKQAWALASQHNPDLRAPNRWQGL